MQKSLLLIGLLCFSLKSHAIDALTVPRQKLELVGLLKPTSPKAISMDQFEKIFKLEIITINDPYNKDLQTSFVGFYFKALIEMYALSEAKIIKINAIDGYQVSIKIADIIKEKMLLVFKDQIGYLKVDRMGPVRIIYPIKGKISKDELFKIGVNWVWQIKSLEFSK